MIPTLTSHGTFVDESSKTRAWIEVELAAIRKNIEVLQAGWPPGTRVVAVLKADAYGLGATTIAQALESSPAVEMVAVATPDEGLELRRSAFGGRIMLLSSIPLGNAELQYVLQNDIEPSVSTPEDLYRIAAATSEQPLHARVHLNVDTGFNRLGCPWNGIAGIVDVITGCPVIQIASAYTHLSTSDGRNCPTTKRQIKRFVEVRDVLRRHRICVPLHVANSAAALESVAVGFEWVRLGLAMYGSYPIPPQRCQARLANAISIRARVVQHKAVRTGERVGYGNRWTAQRDSMIAVLPIGYADGVPLHASGRLSVILQGHVVRQVGAITMDHMMVDATGLPVPHAGDVATLIGASDGQSITVDDWAAHAGTIPWEILSRLGRRLPRIYNVSENSPC